MNRAEKRRQKKLTEKLPKKQAPIDVSQSLNQALQVFNEGNFEKARQLCQQILRAEPSHHFALYLMGLGAHRSGKIDEAIETINKALVIKPDFIEAHSNLGNVYKSAGRFDEAIASYQKAISLKPDYVEAHYNLGNALRDKGNLSEAVLSYQKVISINPGYAPVYTNLGNTLVELNKLEEGIVSYNKAVELTPTVAEAYLNLGNALRDSGDMEKATSCFRKAIAIDPEFGEAYRILSRLKKFSVKDPDIRIMEEINTRTHLDNNQKMHFGFALGKVYDDLKQPKKAFDFYKTANDLKRRSYDYESDKEVQKVDRLKAIYTKEFINKFSNDEDQGDAVIFILGMPRSGTSLIEQIIASHPRVFGAGELENLTNIAKARFGENNSPDFLTRLNNTTSNDFIEAGKAYLQSIDMMTDKADFITDKMPHNFEQIGLIKLALPQAKIIHCRRDPVDTCLSIYKNLLVSERHSYASDLTELGTYYTLYQDLMAHWENVIPEEIYNVSYEDMVSDQEGQSRALIEHCGLEWDDACLNFHTTTRPVKTASSAQVRKPIYKDSIAAWKPYEQQLAPLLKALKI